MKVGAWINCCRTCIFSLVDKCLSSGKTYWSEMRRLFRMWCIFVRGFCCCWHICCCCCLLLFLPGKWCLNTSNWSPCSQPWSLQQSSYKLIVRVLLFKHHSNYSTVQKPLVTCHLNPSEIQTPPGTARSGFVTALVASFHIFLYHSASSDAASSLFL